MAVYGYARVSTDEQTLDAQQEALKQAGAVRVFSEKESGAKTDRSQLARAINAMQAGDILMVTKLDRLARSTRDLLNIIEVLKATECQFKSLGDPWCDSTTPHGQLMLTVLGGLAEFERHLILARTAEGRKRAIAKGIVLGRPHTLTRHQRLEAIARREAGEPTRDIAKTYNVSHMTIVRLNGEKLSRTERR